MASVAVLTGSLEASPGDLSAALALLDKAEVERAASFRFARDRRRFIVRRARLREVLADRCGCDPRDLAFGVNAYGKPELGNGNLHFSASHSDERWLVALSSRPLGADCERVAPLADWAGIAASLFGPSEVKALLARRTGPAPRAFFDCWARKEAFVKALGIGLGYPLDAFEVSVTPEAVMLSGGEGWNMAALPLGPDYAGAVVAEDDGEPLSVTLREEVSIDPREARAA